MTAYGWRGCCPWCVSGPVAVGRDQAIDAPLQQSAADDHSRITKVQKKSGRGGGRLLPRGPSLLPAGAAQPEPPPGRRRTSAETAGHRRSVRRGGKDLFGRQLVGSIRLGRGSRAAGVGSSDTRGRSTMPPCPDERRSWARLTRTIASPHTESPAAHPLRSTRHLPQAPERHAPSGCNSPGLALCSVTAGAPGAAMAASRTGNLRL